MKALFFSKAADSPSFPPEAKLERKGGNAFVRPLFSPRPPRFGRRFVSPTGGGGKGGQKRKLQERDSKVL